MTANYMWNMVYTFVCGNCVLVDGSMDIVIEKLEKETSNQNQVSRYSNATISVQVITKKMIIIVLS